MSTQVKGFSRKIPRRVFGPVFSGVHLSNFQPLHITPGVDRGPVKRIDCGIRGHLFFLEISGNWDLKKKIKTSPSNGPWRVKREGRGIQSIALRKEQARVSLSCLTNNSVDVSSLPTIDKTQNMFRGVSVSSRNSIEMSSNHNFFSRSQFDTSNQCFSRKIAFVSCVNMDRISIGI